MTEYNVETIKKSQQRDIEARNDTQQLLDLGYIKKSQWEVAYDVALACYRAEERTNEVESQKGAYIGVQFNFDSRLEMEIYIITELPKDWEHAQELKVLRQNATDEKTKDELVITIDRINEGTKENRGHYERGNIQILSNEANRAKSAQKKMKPRAVLGNSGYGTELVIGESITATANILGVKGHATAKRYSFPVTRLEPTATEEERKAQCEAYGITYETAEVRAERDERMIASILAKQPQ